MARGNSAALSRFRHFAKPYIERWGFFEGNKKAGEDYRELRRENPEFREGPGGPYPIRGTDTPQTSAPSSGEYSEAAAGEKVHRGALAPPHKRFEKWSTYEHHMGMGRRENPSGWGWVGYAAVGVGAFLVAMHVVNARQQAYAGNPFVRTGGV